MRRVAADFLEERGHPAATAFRAHLRRRRRRHREYGRHGLDFDDLGRWSWDNDGSGVGSGDHFDRLPGRLESWRGIRARGDGPDRVLNLMEHTETRIGIHGLLTVSGLGEAPRGFGVGAPEAYF